jgi:predicted Zn-dependent protease
MDGEARERTFLEAIERHGHGRDDDALRALERLIDDGTKDPAHISLYGLLIARNGEPAEGVRLCEEAVARNGRRSSVLHLNLSRALASAGDGRGAIDVLRRGLLVHPEDKRLRKELQHLVPRGRPMFPRLGRTHAVNKYAGIARTLGGRVWSSLGGRP